MHDEAAGNLMVVVDPGRTLNTDTPAQIETGLAAPACHSHTFGALVKLASTAILRSRKYMFLKFAFYIVMSVFIGSEFYDIGNDETKVKKNVGCIFFTIIFTICIGMMPSILTCMCI